VFAFSALPRFTLDLAIADIMIKSTTSILGLGFALALAGCGEKDPEATTTATTGTTTTETDGTETADTAAGNSSWTPSLMTVYSWQACIDQESGDAMPFSVGSDDYPILIQLLVMDESQANNCNILISSEEPLSAVKGGWSAAADAPFWAAWDTSGSSVTIESDCDVLGDAWVGVADTLAGDTFGFGALALSADAASAGPDIYSNWAEAQNEAIGGGWHFSKFDLTSTAGIAFSYEASIDGDACTATTGDDGYLVGRANTSVELPTGGVTTGVYIMDFPTFVYSGADQIPN
jgi:hypothetical protein